MLIWSLRGGGVYIVKVTCTRRILVLCNVYASQIFCQESQTIADYENMNLVRKAKAAKIYKTVFTTMDFPQRVLKSQVLFDFLQILLRTILCWSVAVRFFNTSSLKVIYVRFGTVLKRMPNIKITTKK